MKIILFLLAHFNSFFNNLFLKFINKFQKEILRCAPPFPHMCDFLSPESICRRHKVHHRRVFSTTLNIYNEAFYENSFRLSAINVFPKISILDFWQSSE